MTPAAARVKLRHALAPFRAGDWWDHKLAALLGTGYMTAFHLRHPLLDLWPTFLATLAGVAAAAAYVSVINDWADLEDDAAAGKDNRLAARGRWYPPAAVGGLLAIGTVVAILAWRDDPLVLALYAGPWLAFSLYSLPPVRLKARGAAGALADASGAHLFPHMLITVAVFHAAGRPLEAWWLVAIGIWALAAGIRGALWHQLSDVEADRRAGVTTFGQRTPARARFTGETAFAIEIAVFFFLLVRSGGSLLAFGLLILYVGLELARVRLFGERVIVVAPVPVHRIAMHEYYLLFYPLAFLTASSFRHGADVLVLIAHTALFRHIPPMAARDARRSLVRLAAGLRAPEAPPGKSPS
jgi:4-hydroxybenzoate polyprenyltransferase